MSFAAAAAAMSQPLPSATPTRQRRSSSSRAVESIHPPQPNLLQQLVVDARNLQYRLASSLRTSNQLTTSALTLHNQQQQLQVVGTPIPSTTTTTVDRQAERTRRRRHRQQQQRASQEAAVLEPTSLIRAVSNDVSPAGHHHATPSTGIELTSPLSSSTEPHHDALRRQSSTDSLDLPTRERADALTERNGSSTIDHSTTPATHDYPALSAHLEWLPESSATARFNQILLGNTPGNPAAFSGGHPLTSRATSSARQRLLHSFFNLRSSNARQYDRPSTLLGYTLSHLLLGLDHVLANPWMLALLFIASIAGLSLMTVYINFNQWQDTNRAVEVAIAVVTGIACTSTVCSFVRLAYTVCGNHRAPWLACPTVYRLGRALTWVSGVAVILLTFFLNSTDSLRYYLAGILGAWFVGKVLAVICDCADASHYRRLAQQLPPFQIRIDHLSGPLRSGELRGLTTQELQYVGKHIQFTEQMVTTAADTQRNAYTSYTAPVDQQVAATDDEQIVTVSIAQSLTTNQLCVTILPSAIVSQAADDDLAVPNNTSSGGVVAASSSSSAAIAHCEAPLSAGSNNGCASSDCHSQHEHSDSESHTDSQHQHTATTSTGSAPTIDSTMCSICFADYEPGDELLQLDCNHTYHIHCIEPWLRRSNSCAYCRRPALAVELLEDQSYMRWGADIHQQTSDLSITSLSSSSSSSEGFGSNSVSRSHVAGQQPLTAATSSITAPSNRGIPRGWRPPLPLTPPPDRILSLPPAFFDVDSVRTVTATSTRSHNDHQQAMIQV